MRLSFRSRLQLALMAAVAVTAAAAFWAVTARIDAATGREERLQADARSTEVATLYAERGATLAAESEAVSLYPAVVTAVDKSNAEPLSTWARAVAAHQATHVTVVDATGAVVARSHDPSHTGDDLAAALPGLRRALAGQPGSGTETDTELGPALRGYAPVLQQNQVVGAVMLANPIDDALLSRLAAGGPPPRLQAGIAVGGCSSSGGTAVCRTVLQTSDGRPAGALAVTVPLTALRQARTDALWATVGIGAPLTLLGILAAWLLGRALSRPLASLSRSAALVSGMSPAPPIPFNGPPEVASLAAALEGLRQRVEAASAALQHDRDVLQAVLEATEDGIILLDNAGLRVAGNGRWAALTAGQTEPDGAIHQHGGSAGLAEIAQNLVTANGRTVEVALERARPYQRFRLYAAPTPLPGRSTIGRILVLHDSTQETAAERMRSALIATVSHELRSPLTAIKGYADSLLNAGPWDAATEQEFLRVIVDSADRLAELVDNLLDAARLESGTLRLEREPVRLEQLARKVLDVRRPLAPAHQLRLLVDEPLPLVEGDPRRLEQVLGNLVDNAIKYAPEGGEITVRVSGRERITVTVSDHGVGIAPEHLSKLFERFYRVDDDRTRSVRGTGLGLFICKSLVEAHGGRLRVASAVGAGSTFTFNLPALPELPSVDSADNSARFVERAR